MEITGSTRTEQYWKSTGVERKEYLAPQIRAVSIRHFLHNSLQVPNFSLVTSSESEPVYLVTRPRGHTGLQGNRRNHFTRSWEFPFAFGKWPSPPQKQATRTFPTMILFHSLQ